MQRIDIRALALGAGLAALLASQFAEAQWVMLARRAIGRVEQMSQTQGDNGAAYDSAMVMIDAPADKVWAAVVRGVHNRSDISITSEDAAGRLIQFTDGKRIAGIKVTAFGDDLTHLLVTSAHTGSQPAAAATVTDSVLRVCKDMNVECARGAQ